MVARTWKDLKGIKLKFPKHSVPKYAEIYTHLNSVYHGEVENTSFTDIFTDAVQTALKPDCATTMVNDAIWEIVAKCASPTTTSKILTTLIAECNSKLVMQFDVGSRPKFLDSICENAIGNGLIEDLLNH